MTIRIESSPKLRSVRPARDGATAGRVRADAARSRRRDGSAGRLLTGLALLALTGSVVVAVGIVTHRPDPHYLQAQRLLQSYEKGRPVRSLNHANPIYQKVLDELVRVDPGSVSAEPAGILRERLERRVRKFRARIAAEKRALAATRQKQLARARATREARQRGIVTPVGGDPECDE